MCVRLCEISSLIEFELFIVRASVGRSRECSMHHGMDARDIHEYRRRLAVSSTLMYWVIIGEHAPSVWIKFRPSPVFLNCSYVCSVRFGFHSARFIGSCNGVVVCPPSVYDPFLIQ